MEVLLQKTDKTKLEIHTCIKKICAQNDILLYIIEVLLPYEPPLSVCGSDGWLLASLSIGQCVIIQLKQRQGRFITKLSLDH